MGQATNGCAVPAKRHERVVTRTYGVTMKDAEEIAMLLFPEDWIANTDNPGFKVDNNYGRRRCAEAVAHYFLEVLRRDTTASAVMHAF